LQEVRKFFSYRTLGPAFRTDAEQHSEKKALRATGEHMASLW
jgi:hypothetical protein